MSEAQPSSAARVLRGLGVSLAVLLALVLAFELVGHLAPFGPLAPANLDPITANLANARVGPHPYLAYAVRPGFVKQPSAKDPISISHNSLGFRGRETTWEKPPGTYRILCLGGSSTYGFGPSSNETNWPERLEAHLNEARPERKVEVINAGCQGYSTFESQINLELRGIDFRPDLVLVYQTINDMRCVLYPNYRRDNTHWRAVWPTAHEQPIVRLLESSVTYLAWRRYLTDWFEQQGALGAWVIVDFGKYADDFAQPTDVELGYACFRRNLVSIVAVAHAHGAEVLLVPEAMRVADFDRAAKSAQIQREAYERMCAITEEVAVERSVPFLRDARTVLEAEAARQLADKLARGETGPGGAPPKDDVFTNEVHLTDAGCELLARTLAEGLRRLGLVK